MGRVLLLFGRNILVYMCHVQRWAVMHVMHVGFTPYLK